MKNIQVKYTVEILIFLWKLLVSMKSSKLPSSLKYIQINCLFTLSFMKSFVLTSSWYLSQYILRISFCLHSEWRISCVLYWLESTSWARLKCQQGGAPWAKYQICSPVKQPQVPCTCAPVVRAGESNRRRPSSNPGRAEPQHPIYTADVVNPWSKTNDGGGGSPNWAISSDI